MLVWGFLKKRGEEGSLLLGPLSELQNPEASLCEHVPLRPAL